jgi:hypothetical protein
VAPALAKKNCAWLFCGFGSAALVATDFVECQDLVRKRLLQLFYSGQEAMFSIRIQWSLVSGSAFRMLSGSNRYKMKEQLQPKDK